MCLLRGAAHPRGTGGHPVGGGVFNSFIPQKRGVSGVELSNLNLFMNFSTKSTISQKLKIGKFIFHIRFRTLRIFPVNLTPFKGFFLVGY